MKQFKFYCPSELIRSIRVGVEMKLIAVSQDRVQINKTLNFIAAIKCMRAHRDGFTPTLDLKKTKQKKTDVHTKRLKYIFTYTKKKQKKNMHASKIHV